MQRSTKPKKGAGREAATLTIAGAVPSDKSTPQLCTEVQPGRAVRGSKRLASTQDCERTQAERNCRAEAETVQDLKLSAYYTRMMSLNEKQAQRRKPLGSFAENSR